MGLLICSSAKDDTHLGFGATPTKLRRVSELGEPERLLADALRAQARSAPAPESPQAPPATPSLPPRYGLLSGTDGGALERERAALDRPTIRQPEPEPKRQPGSLPVYWILLLAVLLGLATGAVVGLITLL